MSKKVDDDNKEELKLEAEAKILEKMTTWDDFLEKNYEAAPSWYSFWDRHSFPYFDGESYSEEEIAFVKETLDKRILNMRSLIISSFESRDYDTFFTYLIRYNISMVNNIYAKFCVEQWKKFKNVEVFSDRVSKVAEAMGDNFNKNPSLSIRRVQMLLKSLNQAELENLGMTPDDMVNYAELITWYHGYLDEKALNEAKGEFSDSSSGNGVAKKRMSKKERKNKKKEETKKESASSSPTSSSKASSKNSDPIEDKDFIPDSKNKTPKKKEETKKNESDDDDSSSSDESDDSEPEKKETKKQVRKVNPAPKVNVRGNSESNKKEDLAEPEAPKVQRKSRKTKEQVEKQQQNFQQQIENKMLNDMAAAPEVKKLSKAEEKLRPSEEMHKELLKKIKKYNESIIFSTSSHDQIMRATKDLENEHLLISLEKKAPEQGDYVLMNQRAIERLSTKGFLKGMTRVDPNRDPQVMSYFTEKIGDDSLLLERGVTCLLKRSGSIIYTKVQKGDYILKGYEEHLKIKTIQSRRRAELVEYGTVVKRKEYTEKRKRATISPSLPEIDLKTLVSLGNTIRNVKNNTVVYNTINEILRVASPYKTYGRLLDLETFQKYWDDTGLSDSDRSDFVRAMTHSQMISKIRGVVPVPARYVNLHSNMEDKKSRACLDLAKELATWADMGDFATKTSADLKKNNQYKRSIKPKFI